MASSRTPASARRSARSVRSSPGTRWTTIASSAAAKVGKASAATSVPMATGMRTHRPSSGPADAGRRSPRRWPNVVRRQPSRDDQPSEVGLQGLELLGADLRGPPLAHLIEQHRADRDHLVAARRHLDPLAARVACVRFPAHVPEALQHRDRLRRSLLGHRQPAPELGGRVGAAVDGAERELVGGTHARVPATRQSGDDLVDHRVEAAEQQQCEVRPAGSSHGPESTVSTTCVVDLLDSDNMVVYRERRGRHAASAPPSTGPSCTT